MSTVALAQRIADRLGRAERAYLLGEDDAPPSGRARLARHGAVDADGRLTAFGALLARSVAADALLPVWTEEDSIALTVGLVCDGARMKLVGAELRVAIVALSRRGLSASRIAARVGCTHKNVAVVARKAGVPIKREQRGVTHADEQKILAAHRGAGRAWVSV